MGPFLLLLTSCHKVEKFQAPVSPKKILRLTIPEDPTTFDPRKATDLVSSCLQYLVFDSLMRIGPSGQLENSLAEDIELSEDRKTYTFHLRDAYWSNGEKIVAQDFVATWKELLHPNFPAPQAYILYPIKNAEAVKRGIVSMDHVGISARGDDTVVVELESACPYFLHLISYSVFFPVQRTVEISCPQWHLETKGALPSSGPFILESWQHNNQIILKKNETYWNKNHIDLDEIHFSIVDNENTALQMFENGLIDFIGKPLAPLSAESTFDYLQQEKLITSPVAASTCMVFNTKNPLFANKNLRKAFAYAINRQEIIDNITLLSELPGLTLVPPTIKLAPERQYLHDYDGQLAISHFTKALAELKLTRQSLPEITFSFAINEQNRKVAQALQQQIQETLGIKISLDGIEHKTYLAKLTRHDYAIGLSVWYAQYPDPMSILERYKFRKNTKNYSDWENPYYIRLLDKASEAKSQRERMMMLEHAESLLLDDLPVCPLFHWSSAYAKKDYVQNVLQTPIGSILFEYIRIEK